MQQEYHGWGQRHVIPHLAHRLPVGLERIRLSTELPRQTAYLIGTHQGGEVIRVYAVLAPSPEVALQQIAASAAEGDQAKVVGSLARDLVRRSKLQTGEVRLLCALSRSRDSLRRDLPD